MAPQLVFGTGVVGMDGMEFQDGDSVTKLLLTLKDLGINRLDTAARYPPFNPGKSESLLGAAHTLTETFVIDTKVYTEVGDGSGDLSNAAIQKSVDGSLERLHRPQGVHILFAHRPDPATPLEEQVQGFQDQVAQGHAKTWGIANHSPETLEKIINLCERKGWEKPSWYQGTYNMLTRGMEVRILPILRAHGVSFLASHALASGFLTGTHIDADGNPTGRFARSAYAAPEVAAAMKKFVAGCTTYGLPPVEVASRWVAYHSALGDEDSIVLGASKLAQVGDTVANIRKGPLPVPVVALTDELWGAVESIQEIEKIH
ncbi:Aflatoxin B1 aldehyde reductase member 2 [Cytospora mali]|uniref:Aflatoxin B1 aldehyde reductase member 2 n=1 Tax=Cytospora mali TaxID=578113 RepID=A0A194VUU8_CYTMA|nr:Aflatoxin B1 aldehyde reductase member 2 [Valsa mali]